MELSGQNVTLDSVVRVARGQEKLTLSAAARESMLQSRAYIESELSKGAVIYGVNTGFGALSSVRISDSDIEKLQKNLIRSHASGVGTPFSKVESRAILYLRANALARGHSGIRPEVVDKILEFLNLDIVPVIPSQGSVGASGDLAPLSHLALALIGEGEVWDGDTPVATEAYLKNKKVKPLELKCKEGLSLINGCQVMTAVGMLAAHHTRHLCLLADVAGAMSLEALRGGRDPFDPLISATRAHPGEKKTASNLLKILGEKSEISESHADCDRVQDAYSLRCMPAVHGAVKDALKSAIETLTIEANSSTDNPLVFSSAGKILSCGNFHGEPVAFQLDFLAIALSALGNISQCRVSRLINPAFSALPAFLAPNGGLNSGLMVVEVAAASLASENKIYAHPASVDSIPTSVDKEDHVSMGTIAARKLKLIVENVSHIMAMEILSSMQALSLLKPLKPAAGVMAAYDLIVADVPLAEVDRVFSQDIKKIKSHIDSGKLLTTVLKSVGELEW
ncbi:MAG: histidine ammonia-lyase [Bdellovibrionales bacterium]|nr:histidine ammonia-lyase [Bdellovibrionales bacterium]